MAVDYTTLFTRLGKIVKTINGWLALQPTIMSSADAVLSQYETRRDLVVGTQQQFANAVSVVAGWEQSLKGVSDSTISALQPNLIAPVSSVAGLLPLLVADMIATSQSVTACAVAMGTPTAGSNVGSGVLKVLPANQRLAADTVVLKCAGDAYTGRTAGNESFAITGQPTASVYSGTLTQGSGSGNLSILDASSLISGAFEVFNSGTPAGWTLDVGPGLSSKETTNVHSGTGALKLTGDGAQATFTMHENVSLIEGATYSFSVWLCKSGTVGAGSNLLIELIGTGLTPVILFNADPSALTTSYALTQQFFAASTTLPLDLNVKVTWTAANTAGVGAIILIDDLVLTAPTQFANGYYALLRGAVDFRVGDSFTVVNTNNHAGVFQTFFGRFYNVDLPTSGSPTINDSLAV